MENSIYKEEQKSAADVLDNMTEAQAAITCFELWQDMLINGTAPDPKRYEAEVLDFYKDVIKGKHAPFYFMFIGFLGGLDFADMTKKEMEEGQPEEEPAQDQKHYYDMSRSIEEMQEAAAAYEASPEGKRFIKSIENAIEFTFKHSNGGLTVTQLNYLANKHCNSLLNGSFDLTALAYRRGYMNGKAAAKK